MEGINLLEFYSANFLVRNVVLGPRSPNAKSKQSSICSLLDNFLWQGAVFIPLLVVGFDLLFHESPDGLSELPVGLVVVGRLPSLDIVWITERHTLSKNGFELSKGGWLLRLLGDLTNNQLLVLQENGLGSVEVLENLSGISSSVLQNYLFSSRMNACEFAHVVDLVLDNKPGITVLVMSFDII